MGLTRPLKNAHLLRFAHPSSLRRTGLYASFLGISQALHLGIFPQPVNIGYDNKLLGRRSRRHERARHGPSCGSKDTTWPHGRSGRL